MSLTNLLNRLLGFQASAEKPLISLGLLLERSHDLKLETVQEAAWEAWTQQCGDVEEGSSVVGEAPAYVVSSRNRSFVVNSHDKPYGKDPQRIAKAMMDEPVRRAYLQHRAWISVDLLRPQVPEGKESWECMGLLGKLASRVAPPDCLLVLAPHNNQMRLCTPEIRQMMQSGNPFDIFRETATAEAAPKARSMAAAASAPGVPARPVVGPSAPPPGSAEAIRRWPEFLAAFGNRRSGQLFSVLVTVSDGRKKEPLWIRVQSISGSDIAGLIDNRPAQLTALRQGDPVTTQVKDVSDWMYVHHGNLVGGFTERITA